MTVIGSLSWAPARRAIGRAALSGWASDRNGDPARQGGCLCHSSRGLGEAKGRAARVSARLLAPSHPRRRLGMDINGDPARQGGCLCRSATSRGVSLRHEPGRVTPSRAGACHSATSRGRGEPPCACAQEELVPPSGALRAPGPPLLAALAGGLRRRPRGDRHMTVIPPPRAPGARGSLRPSRYPLRSCSSAGRPPPTLSAPIAPRRYRAACSSARRRARGRCARGGPPRSRRARRVRAARLACRAW